MASQSNPGIAKSPVHGFRRPPSVDCVPTVIAWLRWKGEAAGFYSDWTGVAIMTVSAVTLLAGLTVWTAFVTDHMDAEREKTGVIPKAGMTGKMHA